MEPLLERDDERAEITAVMRRAEGGEGGAVLVEGPAGIGKTALLRRAAADAERRGLRVLTARGTEVERDFAFGIAHQLFDGVVREGGSASRFRGPAAIARALLEEGAGGDATGLLHGLYWLVANLADEAPLTLIVDDVHWADESSLRFVAFLLPRLAELPVALVLGERTGEAELSAIHGHSDLVRVEPAALSTGAAEDLLERALEGRVDPEFARACHGVTAGNPFYLAELARALETESIEPSADRVPDVERLGPDAIARAILIRLGRISADAVALARAVAILGDDAELRHAAAVAELDTETAATAAGTLVRGAILEDGRPLRFIHPVVRAAVYGDLAAAERATWHRRAADALKTAGAPRSRVAVHLYESEPAADPETVQILCEAAREVAGQGAHDVLVRYARRADAEPPPPDLVALVCEVGSVACTRAGDLEGAIRLADKGLAQEVQTGVHRPSLIGAATSTRALLGRVPEAIDVVDQVRARWPDVPQYAFEANLSAIALAAPRRYPELDARIASYAELDGKTLFEQVLLATVGLYRLLDGVPAAEIMSVIERTATREHLEQAGNDVGFGITMILMLAVDDLDRAEVLADRALELAREWPALSSAGSAAGLPRCAVT